MLLNHNNLKNEINVYYIDIASQSTVTATVGS